MILIMISQYIKTPIGSLKITIEDETIISGIFVFSTQKAIDDPVFDNYFKRLSKEIPVKYKLEGTPFQLKVWNEILNIPYGETRTYGEIANAIGESKSYRAVANACGQNKLALIIPCHRVVGQHNLGGYKWGTDKKKWLLEFEKIDK